MMKRRGRDEGLGRVFSQRPLVRFGRLRRPAQKRGHQATTAHIQAAYPAVTEAGLGSRGVYIGEDAYGGAFIYDPWVLYADRVITNANTLMIGHPGHGKSALTKSYLWRQRVFGRVAEIVDPKGEYEPLVAAMGGVVLALEPGGSVQLNPLTRVGTQEMREGMLEQVTRAILGRPLTPVEAVGLVSALAKADVDKGDAEVCIPDVVERLLCPEVEIADRLAMNVGQARDELRNAGLALRRLCEGPLRGMFDGPTTAGESAWDAPAVSLDLSALRAGATGSDLAVAIAMVCATAFLDAKRTQRAKEAKAEGRTAAKIVRVNDEGWRALPIEGIGEYYQASFKLSRKTGVQHWLVLHRFSDLGAAGDEGSRQQQLAKGLLADTSTVITYHQEPSEIDLTVKTLALTSREAEVISQPQIGQALWRVGGRSFRVQHLLSPIEWDLIDSDEEMLPSNASSLEPHFQLRRAA